LRRSTGAPDDFFDVVPSCRIRIVVSIRRFFAVSRELSLPAHEILFPAIQPTPDFAVTVQPVKPARRRRCAHRGNI
jgi:hypothetical protein